MIKVLSGKFVNFLSSPIRNFVATDNPDVGLILWTTFYLQKSSNFGHFSRSISSKKFSFQLFQSCFRYSAKVSDWTRSFVNIKIGGNTTPLFWPEVADPNTINFYFFYWQFVWKNKWTEIGRKATKSDWSSEFLTFYMLIDRLLRNNHLGNVSQFDPGAC